MMGFGRDANCASWSPSALTVHRTVIHCLLCANPFRIWNSSESKSWKDSKESHGGDDGIRTHDPLLAGQVLSQLSYTPIIIWFVVFSVCNKLSLFGRPKWTRTTDLVLIRHAL